ncbi:MAG: hypothetical protein JSR36_03360 [Proteobacteria bacterium]|nr:hypothetical protein [Pseudomonadota bacterium]
MASRSLFLALLAAACGPASAFTVAISSGSPRTVYLQVGVGSFNGQYDSGGTPLNNATVNKVSVTVPANVLGNGTAQAMTTDSTAANSFYDGYTYCNVPAQLYIGGFYRNTNNGGGSVSVTATVPLSLVNAAGDKLPFSSISWTTGGNGPLGDSTGQPFTAGTFTAGGVQTVGTIAVNHWAESCWTFSFANNTVSPAGTYTGRVLYTLTAP